MGNVRTDQVKRTAKELVRRFPDKFGANFEENKHLAGELLQGTTSKVRNQIAGYITRYYSTQEETVEETTETAEETEGEAE